VRADEAQARAYGISGVPFFVIDGRYGISGAQPADAVLQALDKAWSERPPLTLVTPEGSAPSCEGDSCAVLRQRFRIVGTHGIARTPVASRSLMRRSSARGCQLKRN
jgi:hypothetical protein